MGNEIMYVSFDEAMKLIKKGWIIQYRGKGLISSWIRLVSGGIHSHTAMIVEVDGELKVAEIREFIGGRITDLKYQWNRFAGCLDLYEPNIKNFPELNIDDVCSGMKFIVENGCYSYFNLLKILVRRMPILWRFFDRGTVDEDYINVDDKAWHCSDSVAASFQYGGVDPVPHMPSDLVSPSDLTNSLLFKYRFSL